MPVTPNCILLFALVVYVRVYNQLSWLNVLILVLVLVGIMIVNVDAENAQFKRA